ncbi:MAG TPA: hypothetical protein VFR81_09565 [Longimicrobium sp.]|nr:hypothetical protein [Longimicrobium sp.]
MSTLSLRPDELRVESFAVEGPTGLAQPVTTREPNTWPDCPTATGCTCVATCYGGVCQV